MPARRPQRSDPDAVAGDPGIGRVGDGVRGGGGDVGGGRAGGDVVGIVLAAGAGTRFGGPKALASDARGAWLPRAVATLRAGGVPDVVVVLGAAADDAVTLLVDPADAVVADDWMAGLSHSLAAGIRTARRRHPNLAAVLVTLVDLPDLPAASVARIADGAAPDALRRAVHDGVPGHPVLLGAAHLDGVLATLTGDRGAGPYLAAHAAEPVDLSVLGGGADVDAR